MHPYRNWTLWLLGAAAPAGAQVGVVDAAADAPTVRVPLGGPATVRDTSPNAFGYPAPTLGRLERRRFLVGNSFFKQNWIEAPASASQRDGLGPLFNARSCSACHLRDGRSAPPAETDRERHGLLLRIGVRGADGADLPHPIYGGQVQDAAVRGVTPEARTVIEWSPIEGRFADGTSYELLAPAYSLAEPGYGVLGDDVTLGPRVAPALVGLGLLEAVPLATLEALSDADDRDGDGVSGRVHRVDGGRAGRFGWKATQPTVREQVTAALANDMGITSTPIPDETLTPRQLERIELPTDEVDIRDETLEKLVFYTQVLAVPAQRDADAADVRHGERLFATFGCAACHVPELRTGDEACHPSFAQRAIRPYTDLLLHDMGEGLADGKHDGDAAPGEWRTPPLWGLGMLATVSGHTRLLHDGRARGASEAILWHGGEALAAREAFRNASAEDRAALLAFLASI